MVEPEPTTAYTQTPHATARAGEWLLGSRSRGFRTQRERFCQIRTHVVQDLATRHSQAPTRRRSTTCFTHERGPGARSKAIAMSGFAVVTCTTPMRK